jgi:hypothetical protein
MAERARLDTIEIYMFENRDGTMCVRVNLGDAPPAGPAPLTYVEAAQILVVITGAFARQKKNAE